MHNVTNYFIVNLAIADMCVCFVCLPITLLSNIYTGQCVCAHVGVFCVPTHHSTQPTHHSTQQYIHRSVSVRACGFVLPASPSFIN